MLFIYQTFVMTNSWFMSGAEKVSSSGGRGRVF